LGQYSVGKPKGPGGIARVAIATRNILPHIFANNTRDMKKKRFVEDPRGDEERSLLNGNRRAYPGVEINYLREEGWDQGRVYISITRDSEAMPIEQFEVFIAMFRKVIDVAQRKEREMNCVCDVCPGDAFIPHVEMVFDNTFDPDNNVMFTVSDNGGQFSIPCATHFADLMDKLLSKGREIIKLAA